MRCISIRDRVRKYNAHSFHDMYSSLVSADKLYIYLVPSNANISGVTTIYIH